VINEYKYTRYNNVINCIYNITLIVYICTKIYSLILLKILRLLTCFNC